MRRPKVQNDLPRAVEDNVLKTLVDGISDLRDKAIILLFVYTGLRLAELCQLNRNTITTYARELPAKGKQYFGMGEVGGKGSKRRQFLVGPAATGALKAYIRECRTKDIRVTFVGYLEASRLPVQIDIGFGDAITPDPTETTYPTLLENPAPVLLAYPRETVVAEKFEALVKLGIANTRMKDFHDLKTLASLFPFDGSSLSEAIRRTFERRKTPLPLEALPTALTAEFYDDATKQKQWNAFVTKNKLYIEPITLQEVTAGIEAFVMPVLPASAAENLPTLRWEPGGPWKRI
ncbi:MAG: nucleotidyl transferase AbiEii/AbiGii toxin family protein [Terracidiphilus sp.]